MTERASGYVTDVGYTCGYHATLNPLSTRLAFLRAGLAPPRIANACELGFGQGVSLAVHAAASTVRWWGVDLLPGHVRFAQSLLDAAGADAALFEATFEEFAARDDLPLFDFIGLHGVLSWVSAENRACIAGFLRDRLAPGGVVYAGYNALPGWAELVPLRQIMTAHAALSSGNTVARIEAALDFTERLLDVNPRGARSTPGLAERFARLRHADRRYLAHEYFNRDWQPLGFAEVSALMSTAGLRYACPAQLRDHLDELNLTDEQRQLLARIEDPSFRETVRDYVTNAAVRRDYWVRERALLPAAQLSARWPETRVVLTTPRAAVAERVTGPLGELRLTGPTHHAVLGALADGTPHAVGEISGTEDIAAAVFELAAVGYVSVAQDDVAIGACERRVEKLNAALDGLGPVTIDVRASAVTGGGIITTGR